MAFSVTPVVIAIVGVMIGAGFVHRRYKHAWWPERYGERQQGRGGPADNLG